MQPFRHDYMRAAGRLRAREEALRVCAASSKSCPLWGWHMAQRFHRWSMHLMLDKLLDHHLLQQKLLLLHVGQRRVGQRRVGRQRAMRRRALRRRALRRRALQRRARRRRGVGAASRPAGWYLLLRIARNPAQDQSHIAEAIHQWVL